MFFLSSGEEVLVGETSRSSVYPVEPMPLCYNRSMETVSELLKDGGDEQWGGTVADKDAPWSCSSVSLSSQKCAKN